MEMLERLPLLRGNLLHKTSGAEILSDGDYFFPRRSAHDFNHRCMPFRTISAQSLADFDEQSADCSRSLGVGVAASLSFSSFAFSVGVKIFLTFDFI